MRDIKSIAFLLLVFASLMAASQSVSSVYSNRGVGLVNYQGLPHNVGMGEVGIAVPSIWNLNYVNPSFLPLHSTTMFQVGVEMDRRNITSESLSSKRVSGGLRYLNLGFPVINNRWSTAIGISPYSTVNNKTFSAESIEADITAETYYQGAGGITSMNWSNGFRLGTSLYAGFRSSVMFGSVDENETTIINDGGVAYSVSFTDRTAYSGVKFDVSMGYRHFIGDEKAVNFGVVYELGKNLKGSHDQWMETTALTRRLVLVNDPAPVQLPSAIGLGVSYQILNKFMIASDLTFTNWSQSGGELQDLSNTMKVGLGAQFTPDYTSVSSYLARASYRMGISFGTLPYVVSGNQLNELGINFGGSFPVGFSNLDWAFKYGRLGTLENGLIRENYFRIVIGATMNDRWFVKRRYD